MNARAVSAATALAALILAPLLVLPSLQPNNSAEVYLPADAEGVRIERAVRERFPDDEFLVLLFRGEGLLGDAALREFERLAEDLAQDPYVDRVLSLTSADRIGGSEDGFVVEALLSSRASAGLSIDERRERVQADRFAPGFLVDREVDAVAILLRARGLEDSNDRRGLLDRVLAELQAGPLATHLRAVGGQVALDVAQLRSMIHDTLTFVPLTMSLGLAVIWWLFRRGMAVVLAGLTIAAVVAPTVGLAAVLGRPYSLVLAMLPSLLAALTVALLVHLFGAIQFAAQRGWAAERRLGVALALVRRPALYTAMTTAAGLASLGLSPVPPVRDFGLLAAFGCLLLVAVAIGLLPPLIGALDRGPWQVRGTGTRVIQSIVDRLARIGIRRAGLVLAVFGIALAAGAPQVWRIVVETDFYEFFAPKHPLIRSTQEIERGLSGVTPLEVVFRGPGRDSLAEPERLRAIARFQQRVETIPGVSRVTSMVDLLEEMNWAFHEERAEYRRLPDNRPLVSQYLLIYDGVDLWELLDRDLNHARVVLNLTAHGSGEIRRIMREIEAELATEPPADLSWQLAGFGRLFSDQERLLVQGQIRSVIAALATLFVLLWLLWRSLGTATLCMIPNLAPVALIFIAMGLSATRLDMATVLIASVAVGIAVDDTIHLFHAYHRGRRRGASTVRALAGAYRRAGRAIVATTLILGSQFMLLGLSDFVPTAEFGLLTAVGLVAALLFDLLLLPALIVLLSRRRNPAV